MTVAVVTTPPGTAQTFDSGATVDVPSGGAVVFQIADVLPDGSRGEVWPLEALRFEAIGSDLRVTAPDGSALLFAGLAALLAGATPARVFAGPTPDPTAPEQIADAPAAGPEAAGPAGPQSGGSSQAANAFFDDGLGNDFGAGPGGGFEQPGTAAGGLPTQDPNLPLLVLAQEAEAAADDPTPPGRPDEENGGPPSLAPGEEPGEEPDEGPEEMAMDEPLQALASLAGPPPGDTGDAVMAAALGATVQEGTPGPDVFRLDAAEASESLDAAAVIRGFEDGVDSIEISGAGPTDIVVADAGGLGGTAGDTALALADGGAILAILADVPATEIDGADLVFA